MFMCVFQRWQEIFDNVDSEEKKWLSPEDWNDFNLEMFNAFPRIGVDYFKSLYLGFDLQCAC